MKTFAGIALTLFAAVGIAYASPLPEPMAPVEATPMITDRDGDSLSVRVSWSPAPRAQWYVAEIGDDAGTWTRSVEADESPATLWAPMIEEEQPAFVCVTAWNRHPVRGPQEGGTRCQSWTVPGDLAPPGQPGDVQVLPDTVEVAIRGVTGPEGASTYALGDNDVWIQGVGQAMGMTLACVDHPSGVRGWLEASVTPDAREIRSVPSPGFWAEPDCAVEFNLADLSPGTDLEILSAPGVPVLAVHPGATPVLLSDAPIRVRVHAVP